MAKVFRLDDRQCYYANLRTTTGGRMRLPLLPNKRDSEELVRQLERAVKLRQSKLPMPADVLAWLGGIAGNAADAAHKLGIVSDTERKQGGSLADLVTAWRESMEAGGCTADHAAKQSNRVIKLADGCGFVTPADLNGERIKGWLARQRAGEGQDRPLSVGTSNAYLVAVKGFANWLVGCGVLPSNPLAAVSKLTVTEPTRNRRALTQSELLDLLTAVQSEPVRYGLTGEERMRLYAAAAQSGLRANELATICRSDLDLGDSPDASTWTVRAKNAKSRKTVTLPIHSDVVALLRDHCARMMPGARIFKVPARTAEMLALDLKAAGIEPVNDQGTADFHALRTSFATRLGVVPGMAPSNMAALCRHAIPGTTQAHYFKPALLDLRAALESLPSILPAAQIAVATGTDGSNTYGLSYGLNSGPNESQSGTYWHKERTGAPSRRMAPEASNRKGNQGVASGRPGESRTLDQGIMSPLL